MTIQESNQDSTPAPRSKFDFQPFTYSTHATKAGVVIWSILVGKFKCFVAVPVADGGIAIRITAGALCASNSMPVKRHVEHNRTIFSLEKQIGAAVHHPVLIPEPPLTAMHWLMTKFRHTIYNESRL